MDALRTAALAACRLGDADATAGIRHIAATGFAPLPALLHAAARQSSNGGNASMGDTERSDAVPSAEGGADTATAAASAAAAAAVPPAAAAALPAEWRPEALLWLEGVQCQAGMQYEAAAVAYQAALDAGRLDAATRRFVADRLAECWAATGDWAALQQQAADGHEQASSQKI